MKNVWVIAGLQLIWVIPIFCLLGTASPEGKPRITHIPLAEASESFPGRALACDEKKPQRVRVGLHRLTVISFPFKPKDVVPGEGSFDFKQIKNDLVIKALRPGAQTNLLVYLEDRRCAFELVAVASGSDEILTVRDARDEQIEVPFHD